MNAVPTEPLLRNDGRWSGRRWFTLILLVFAAHVGLIFAFGTRQPIVPRAVTNVPTLLPAGDAGELFALNDPTLFVLPNQHDFAGAAWLQVPSVPWRSFRWTEPPQWLELSADKLGTAFARFTQTNRFAAFQPELKPPPKFNAPEIGPVEPAFAEASTLQIEGDLAQWRMPGAMNLPSWPCADVLAPSVVQVVVDAAGNVASVALLSGSGLDIADQRALELARTASFEPSLRVNPGAARFAPASRLTIGRLIFNWHTVPLPPSRESGTPANP
jgi:TonB family protein